MLVNWVVRADKNDAVFIKRIRQCLRLLRIEVSRFSATSRSCTEFSLYLISGAISLALARLCTTEILLHWPQHFLYA